MRNIIINSIVVGSILTTATYAEDNKKDTLSILNNRLQELYKAKNKCQVELNKCNMVKNKECRNIEHKCYDIKDEIKRLMPIIREKELLSIIRNK